VVWYAHQAIQPGLPGLSAVHLRIDLARKVVGVGSVGTRAWIMLLSGIDDQDPLLL
jgi:hypothetical protein